MPVMQKIEVTPQKYAKWYGCKVQYIHRLLKEERLDLLPNVIRVKKYSRFYVLEVPVGTSKDSFKELLPPKG